MKHLTVVVEHSGGPADGEVFTYNIRDGDTLEMHDQETREAAPHVPVFTITLRGSVLKMVVRAR